ncbi:MAG: hypothetical protein P8Z30_08920 [Acidobacteriota bacterium]
MRVSMTRVYGYLLGTVNPPGSSEETISFKYYRVKESEVPPAVVNEFTPGFVNWCFEDNYKASGPAPAEK